MAEGERKLVKYNDKIKKERVLRAFLEEKEQKRKPQDEISDRTGRKQASGQMTDIQHVEKNRSILFTIS